MKILLIALFLLIVPMTVRASVHECFDKTHVDRVHCISNGDYALDSVLLSYENHIANVKRSRSGEVVFLMLVAGSIGAVIGLLVSE